MIFNNLVVLIAFSFFSSLLSAKHHIVVKKTESLVSVPTVLRDTGFLTHIEVAKPVSGVSSNYFSKLELDGPIEIGNSDRANRIIFMVDGGASTKIRHLGNFTVEHAHEIPGVTLVIQNANGVELNNCSAHQISLEIVGGQITILNGGIRAAGDLKLDASSIHNKGPLISDGNLMLRARDKCTNEGTLQATESIHLQVVDKVFNQQGNIFSSGPLIVEGQDGLAKAFDNTGKLRSNGKMRISASSIANRLPGIDIAWGEESKTPRGIVKPCWPGWPAYQPDFERAGLLKRDAQRFVKEFADPTLEADTCPNLKRFELSDDQIAVVAKIVEDKSCTPTETFAANEIRRDQDNRADSAPAQLVSDASIFLQSDDILNEGSWIMAGKDVVMGDKMTKPKVTDRSIGLWYERKLTADDLQLTGSRAFLSSGWGIFTQVITGGLVTAATGIAIGVQGSHYSPGLNDLSRKEVGDVNYVDRNSVAFEQAQKCNIANVKGYSADHTIVCENYFTTIPSTIEFGGALTGHTRDLHLLRQFMDGKEPIETPISAELARKHSDKRSHLSIRPEEQTVDLLKLWKDVIGQKTVEYQKMLPGYMPTRDQFWSRYIAPSLKEVKGVGTLMRSHSPGWDVSGDVILMEPSLEHDLLRLAIYKTLGSSQGLTAEKLYANTLQFGKALGFVPGVKPTDAQLAVLPCPIVHPMQVVIHANGLKAWVPEVLFDRVSIAASLVPQGGGLIGGQLTILVDGDVNSEMVIETTSGDLKLRAKNLYLSGSMTSSRAAILKADHELFLQAIMETRGAFDAEAGEVIKVEYAEVTGGQIRLSSGGKILFVSPTQYQRFKDSWNEGIEHANKLNARNGSIEATAKDDIGIFGTWFKAASDVNIVSEAGSVISGAAQYVASAFTSSTSWCGWTSWCTNTEEVQHTHAQHNKVELGGNFNVYAKKDVQLFGLDVKAKAANLKAGEYITIGGSKSSVVRRNNDNTFSLFNYDADGLNLFTNNGRSTFSNDEMVNLGLWELSGQLRAETPQMFIQEASAIRAGDGTVIDAAKGIWQKSVSEMHSKTTDVLKWGLGFFGTLNWGEQSIGLGVHTHTDKTEVKAEHQVTSTLSVDGHATLRASEGDVVSDGGTYTASVLEVVANNFLMRAVYDIYDVVHSHLWIRSGVKAGTKTPLLAAGYKLYHNVKGLVDSDWLRPETYANLGFKTWETLADVGGLARMGPGAVLQGGLWVNAEGSYDSDSTKKREGRGGAVNAGTLKVNVKRDFGLEGATVNVVDAEIDADTQTFVAAESTEEKTGWGAGGSVDIPIPVPLPIPPVTPSASASGYYRHSSAKTHRNTHFNVAGTLKAKVRASKLKGALMKVGRLEGTFGDLLVESVQDEFSEGGYKGSVSINPNMFNELGKLFTGLSGNVKHHTKKWVSEISGIITREQSDIVVAGTLHVIGAIIANAEMVKGKLVDKGELNLQALHTIAETLNDHDFGIDVGAGYGGGFHTPGSEGASETSGQNTVNPPIRSISVDFGMHNGQRKLFSTIGKGLFNTSSDARGVNRDVSALDKTSLFEVKPIHVFATVNWFPDKLPGDLVQWTKDVDKWWEDVKEKNPFKDKENRKLFDELKDLREKTERDGDTQGRDELDVAGQAAKKGDELKVLADNLGEAEAQTTDPEAKAALGAAREVVQEERAQQTQRAKNIRDHVGKAKKGAGPKQPFVKQELDKVKPSIDAWSHIYGHDDLKKEISDAYSRAGKAAKSGDVKEAHRQFDIVRDKQLDLMTSAYEANVPAVLGPFEPFGAVMGAAKFAAILANPKAFAALKSVITKGADVLRGMKPVERINALKEWAGQFTRTGRADGATKGGIPGIDRPFRVGNSAHPPIKEIVEKMNRIKIQKHTDCSEIAEDLFDFAGGKGKILEVLPAKGKNLKLFENGNLDEAFEYHQVFTDGKYIYDPRLSSRAVPKGDWERMVQKLNPGATIR